MQRMLQLSPRSIRILSALGAGIMLGIGFVLPLAWPAVFFGVAFLIHGVRKSRSLRSAFLYAWLAGVVLYLWALYGVFWETMPIDWFGISEPLVQIFAVGGVWMVNAIILGLGVGIFALFVYEYTDGSWRDLFLIPSGWVLSEWIGSIIIYGANFGPGSLFGPHFTLGWIGYLIAHNSFLLQFAWLGGIYALSFIAAGIGVIVLMSFSMKGRARVWCGVALVGIMLVVVVGGHLVQAIPSGERQTLRVAVISRYVPPHLTMSIEEEGQVHQGLQDLITPLRSLDVLVFPEDSAFLRSLREDASKGDAQILSIIGSGSTTPLVIDSEDLRLGDEPIHSQVSYFTASSTTYGYKQFLLPMGEHIPYFYQVLIRLLGGSELLQTFVDVRGYAPGPSGGVGVAQGSVIAARFCDESMSPELYRAQVRTGANILVDISSLSWFHGSPLVYEQMKLIAKVRAVENGRFFVQSGNMSPAFIVDDHGRLVDETEWGKASVLVHDVSSKSGMTLYSLAGSLVLVLPILIILLGTFWQARKSEAREAAQSSTSQPL